MADLLNMPRKIEEIVEWSKMNEEIRVAHNKKVENSQKPSMWEYNPKGGVPTEFVNLDPSTFLISRQGRILCFLQKDVLIRICSMLSACDFVHLSLTCRFLHWRMFTFCTCYASYSVQMRIQDESTVQSDGVYLFGDHHPRYYYGTPVRVEDARRYSLEKEGLLVYQPFCLRKPFFFEELYLDLLLPSYTEDYYDMCLPYIMAVRGLAQHLNLTMFYQLGWSFENKPLYEYDYSDTNDFFTTIKASYYHWLEERFLYPYDEYDGDTLDRYNCDIYMNCPYARQMYRAVNTRGRRLNVPIYQNSIGTYWDPLDSAIIATLKNFLTGSTNLIFHVYYEIHRYRNGDTYRYPLFEYLFQELGESEEFFHAQKTRNYNRNFSFSYQMWKKVVETKNGGQLRIVIGTEGRKSGYMVIGKEETFEKMDKQYNYYSPYCESNVWWKMETAVEPDETEELYGTVDPETAVESEDVKESDDAVKLDDAVKSDEVEKLAVVDESKEEEQPASKPSIFRCLNNNCSIQ